MDDYVQNFGHFGHLVRICVHTEKICDSALGLTGFVSFFWWAYLRGAYPMRIHSYVLWAYLTKLTFLGGGLSAGVGGGGGGAITDFYGM